jgi:hypothetical protein
VWFAVAGLFQAWRLYRRDTKPETVESVEHTGDLPESRSHRHA